MIKWQNFAIRAVHAALHVVLSTFGATAGYSFACCCGADMATWGPFSCVAGAEAFRTCVSFAEEVITQLSSR